MLKKCLPLIVFALSARFLWSETFYQEISPAVIYLDFAIYLDGNDCRMPGLFRRMEQKSGIGLLDRDFSIRSGSGVIIDSRGYALTNRHLVRISDLVRLKDEVAGYWGDRFLEVYGEDWDSYDRRNFINEFSRMLQEGDLKLKGTVNGRTYNVQIVQVAEGEEPDLALLRLISADTFTPLRITGSERMDVKLVGEEVYSFGYPLGHTMDSLFTDPVVTMNEGRISAYRRDNLDLQHSADISAGNSGGPLVGTDHSLLGLNTAMIEEGNSLYYATGASHIRKFLRDRGYEDILLWNDRSREESALPPLNGKEENGFPSEITSSSYLLLNVDAGSSVFEGGVFRGKPPLS